MCMFFFSSPSPQPSADDQHGHRYVERGGLVGEDLGWDLWRLSCASNRVETNEGRDRTWDWSCDAPGQERTLCGHLGCGRPKRAWKGWCSTPLGRMDGSPLGSQSVTLAAAAMSSVSSLANMQVCRICVTIHWNKLDCKLPWLEHWGGCSLKNLSAGVHDLYWCCHISLWHCRCSLVIALSWLWWEGISRWQIYRDSLYEEDGKNLL